MSTENLNMDEITEARRKSLAGNLKPITVEAMKDLGEGLFPYLDHPWREKYFTFVAENPNATYYHGTTDDGIHILYCNVGRGMWFIPGRGTGIMQPKGLKILEELVKGAK